MFVPVRGFKTSAPSATGSPCWLFATLYPRCKLSVYKGVAPAPPPRTRHPGAGPSSELAAALHMYHVSLHPAAHAHVRPHGTYSYTLTAQVARRLVVARVSR